MDWKGKTVLVTGGTGFIGSFLVERLLDAGARLRVPIRAQNYRALSERRSEVEWIEGDLRDSAYCMDVIEGVDYIFHLASCRRTMKYHEKKSSQVMLENVRTTVALLDAIREKELSVPVTFFSTANVPPESDVLSLSQREKVDGYTLGKAMCEILWYTAARERGFPLLIARPVGVYGPRDTFAEDGNLVPMLMMKARDEEVLDLWGTGEEERAFLYVEDLVTALLALVDAGAEGVQYISSGAVHTVREVAEQIRDLVRPGLPIQFDPQKHIGPRSIPLLPPHASIAKIQWVGLGEGLRRTYESWK